MNRRRLAFVIHDLNPWGGHDRSTLEIARRLSHHFPTDVYAYTLHDPELSGWKDLRLHRIVPDVRRPAAARITYFYGAVLAALNLSRLKGEPRPLIHATGACTFRSDVVQVQFVGAAWRKKQAVLPEDVCARPFSRGESGLKSRVRRLYHDGLLDYNVAVEKKAYTPEKTYIAIAQSVAEELRENFGLSRNIQVIHHGVDSRAFAPASGPQRAEREALRERLGVGRDEVLVAFVGAYERKGLAVSIDALARLSAEARAKVKLMAVGGGAAEGFRARARALGVADRLILVGHTKDVPAYYRAADSFLLPTLYEPFGLVILEAMACGLASIVSALAGGAELIREGESGLLIRDPADPVEVSRHLERVVLDTELRHRLGEGARRVALERSWDRVADEYAAVLAPLLAKDPST